MKHTLLIITALMLVVGCSSDPIDGSTLIEKGGLMYAPGSDKPYSGDAVWHYNSEVNRKEGTFKNGVPDGVWTKWYSNGQKCEEETYKDGKIDGLYTYWYENGQKKSESTYRYGRWNLGKCWDEDGNEMDCPG